MPSFKVIEAIGSQNKTVSHIELDMGEVSQSAKQKAKELVGELLIEEVLKSVGEAKTPIQGESWPTLSPHYKAIKRAEGGVGKPNMELTGDMLDSLKAKPTSDGLEIGFFNSQAWKADGHLKFSGATNNTPQRRFLPDEGQRFNKEIEKKIQGILNDVIIESVKITNSDLEDIETSGDLYDLLMKKFSVETRSEARELVSRSESLVKKLRDKNLLELL